MLRKTSNIEERGVAQMFHIVQHDKNNAVIFFAIVEANAMFFTRFPIYTSDI